MRVVSGRCFSLFLFFQSIFCFPAFGHESPKQFFIDKVITAATAANGQIQIERRQLALLSNRYQSGQTLSARQVKQLSELSFNYLGETPRVQDSHFWMELNKRIDTLPLSLILAQGAVESAWGNSRFALEGNNLFGHWCYQKGCGLVPKKRKPGATHEVRKFRSIEESVATYLKNLNTNPAYFSLREARAKLRASQSPVTAKALTPHLIRYSQQGKSYTDNLDRVIAQNHFERFDW